MHSRLAILAVSSLLAACGGSVAATGDGGPGGVDAGVDGPTTVVIPTAEAGKEASAPLPPPTGKLDLLFLVSNNAFMADKLPVLQASVGAMLDRLLNPNCLDAQGNALGASQNGQCAQGKLEFQPVQDMHIGVLSSALGGRGGDACSEQPGMDDHGHLVNRGGPGGAALGDAQPSGFLAWFPSGPATQGQPAPVDPPLTSGATLVGDFQGLIAGVGTGCGYGAPLESWYRFLIQPDPFANISVTNSIAQVTGVDATILQQRHDFLRPDSAVAVVVVADENERTVDPLSLQGQGWAFENLNFPASPTEAAPEGTVECATAPESTDCTSCAFITADPSFAMRCPNDPPSGTAGYLDPSDDALNVRFFHMKQRFGLDPEFPVARYVSALTSEKVPDCAHERDSHGDYAPTANCTNPLFSATLPTSTTADLCNLPPGPRVPNQVFFAVITGVPHQLLQVDPSNPDSPQKATLAASDWQAILGADPLNYDFTGADFHMLESEAPRTGSSCPTTAADTCDPINGREWNTSKSSLQFACIFDLETPQDCSLSTAPVGCPCAPGSTTAQTPLCSKETTGAYTATQIKAGAFPAIRELAVAKGVGSQSVVSSICPIHTSEVTTGDPLYAYRPALDALVDRLAPVLR